MTAGDATVEVSNSGGVDLRLRRHIANAETRSARRGRPVASVQSEAIARGAGGGYYKVEARASY